MFTFQLRHHENAELVIPNKNENVEGFEVFDDRWDGDTAGRIIR